MPLYTLSLSKSQGDARVWGGCTDFSPPNHSLKIICKSRGVQQDTEPLPAPWAGRILPLRAVDPTKTTKCQLVEQCPEGTWIE